MTVEAVLLAALSVFILGAFVGSTGPQATFQSSGPRLAARIEYNTSTGIGLKPGGQGIEWLKQDGSPPTGALQ
jgi:hypothetical protein